MNEKWFGKGGRREVKREIEKIVALWRGSLSQDISGVPGMHHEATRRARAEHTTGWGFWKNLDMDQQTLIFFPFNSLKWPSHSYEETDRTLRDMR